MKQNNNVPTAHQKTWAKTRGQRLISRRHTLSPREKISIHIDTAINFLNTFRKKGLLTMKDTNLSNVIVTNKKNTVESQCKSNKLPLWETVSGLVDCLVYSGWFLAAAYFLVVPIALVQAKMRGMYAADSWTRTCVFVAILVLLPLVGMWFAAKAIWRAWPFRNKDNTRDVT